MSIVCQRCGAPVRSFSPMRKWCVECRHAISLEQARVRKTNNRRAPMPKQPIRPILKLKMPRAVNP